MDDQLMLIYNGIVISWFAFFVSVGCLLGIVVSCILRLVQRKSVSDVFIVTMLSVPLGLFFGRILYCLFSNELLSGFDEYINLTNGGFGLFGVMLGVFFAVVIACKVFSCGQVGELLDCIVPGGTLAITIGRFATRFTTSEIGYPVDFKLFTVYDVKENVYNLAIFDRDGTFEAISLIICLFTFFYTRHKKASPGLTSLVMLALHGTNQVLMDSMRADPLMLGINNFIKISQIIGILCCISILVYFMIISAKKDRFSKFHMISIPIILVSIFLGVMGEYRVGSTNYISKHLLMLLGMLMLDWLTLVFAFKSVTVRQTDAVEAKSQSQAYSRQEIPEPVQRYPNGSHSRTSSRNNGFYSEESGSNSSNGNRKIDYENLKHELDKLNI